MLIINNFNEGYIMNKDKVSESTTDLQAKHLLDATQAAKHAEALAKARVARAKKGNYKVAS
jgi:hypothetical protein